ncbi:hypothetical protein [Mammaliicoccus vitulinus]|uniref:hypothetical protein n=1 Tax=Mammaliicoccus vitulinus TaxID=71237 RepID=UPI00248D0617|nr:hypothetical protein [Mammaliicoccus vitulinus]
MSKIKSTYKIPHTINVKKGLDDPVALKSGSVGLPAPVPIKIIVMFSIALVVYMASVGFMIGRNFGVFAPILFTIGYIGLARMMLKKEKTGERGFKWVMPTLMYYPLYKLRNQSTRGTAYGNEVERLKGLIPLEDINPEEGVATFTNGDIAVAMDIVGNGSNSLFDNEKEDIILAFDQFLRELEMGVSFIVDMKEGKQNCEVQLDNLEAKRIENTNPTTDMILKRRINGLQSIQQNFKTTEYTLFLRANTPQKLDATLKVLKQKRQSGMFKYIRKAYNDEVYEKYRSFYSLE